MRRALLVLAWLAAAGPIGPVLAQEGAQAGMQDGAQERARDAATLADIRQDLTVLNVEVQRLRTELSTTSGPSVPTGGALGDTLLDRVAVIESELQRLTSKAEELEFRIERIVEDGTNRIGDLEFRLLELEGGDLGGLGQTPTLGGEVGAGLDGGAVPPSGATLPDATGGGDVAVAERADVEAAEALLAGGDAPAAAAAFEDFLLSYPGSPFEARARLGRGDALAAMGDAREAGRAYLAAYNTAPDGATAPVALLRLVRQLDTLGERDAACRILGQLSAAFPGSDEALEANALSGTIGCL